MGCYINKISSMFKVFSLVASAAACSTDKDCKTSSPNLKCSGGICVECRTNSSCEERQDLFPGLFACESNKCVECTGNGDCEQQDYFGNKDVCKGNVCIECTGNGDCEEDIFGNKDVCKGNVCVECTGNGDCRDHQEIFPGLFNCDGGTNKCVESTTEEPNNTNSVTGIVAGIVVAGMFLF